MTLALLDRTMLSLGVEVTRQLMVAEDLALDQVSNPSFPSISFPIALGRAEEATRGYRPLDRASVERLPLREGQPTAVPAG